MAVDKQKIKDRLKVKFPTVNFSQKRLDELSDRLSKKPEDNADDATIDAFLDEANELLQFESLAKEDDRVRTLEIQAKKVPTPAPVPTPANPEPVPTPTPENNDVSAQLLAAIGKLTEKVTALESGKVTETKKQTASALFEKSEVLKNLKPEVKATWLNRIDVNSETTAEDQIKALETEYAEITQTVANSTQHFGPVPTGEPNTKPDDKLIENIVDSL